MTYFLLPHLKGSVRRRVSLAFIALVLTITGVSQPCCGIGQLKVDLPGGIMKFGDIINCIRHQTPFGVGNDKYAINNNWRIRMKKGPIRLDSLFKIIFTDHGLVIDSTPTNIYIKKKPKLRLEIAWKVKLMVTGIDGELLTDVSVVTSSGQPSYWVTNESGLLVLDSKKMPMDITLSHTGYLPKTLHLRDSGTTQVNLLLEDKTLDDAVVFGYRVGNHRNATGNNLLVKKDAKHQQANTTLPSFLTGQVPGVLPTQTSGVPGSVYAINIRGRSSVINGNDPLFIINGVPFPAGNQSSSYITTGNAGGSLSPLSFVTMHDIESVEVLKDADATAIYGSRGANGVILIRTRQSGSGPGHVSINIANGLSWVTRRPRLMQTDQYLAMREEALKNDGLVAQQRNFPEQLWDRSRSADYGKFAIGGQGRIIDANVSYSGTTGRVNYFFGGNGMQETNVFPTHPAHRLLTANGSLGYRSSNSVLEAEVSGLWGNDNNRQFVTDLTQVQFLAPNVPALTDASSRPLWQTGGVSITNPWYFIGNAYKAVSSNLLVSGNLKWRPIPSLQLRLNGGYGKVSTNEDAQMPIWNQDPGHNPTGSSYWATTTYRGYIFEPQLEYTVRRSDWLLTLLGGSSWQGTRNAVSTVSANGFTADSLLQEQQMAGIVERSGDLSDYLYKALFTCVNFNWKDRYILNVTGRRDGTNRFAGAKAYGNFGAVGAAWVFSGHAAVKKLIPFISLGKLRGSYGVTGNDQIGGGNRYLESWAPTSVFNFQNVPGAYSTGPVDPSVSWEKVRKMEVSLEMGIKNRHMFTVTWYRHRSDHQLLPDSFPLTGSPIQLRNRPVVIENRGWEFNLTSKIIDHPSFGWTMAANLSLPVSKLVAFEGLAASPFGRDLVVGRSLGELRGYRYMGVSPLTGVYQFEDRNGDGKINDADRTVVGNLDVTCYGGWENTFRWKRWGLETLVEGRKQMGASYEAAIFAANPPGSILSGFYSNQPAALNNRWRKPGDVAPYQMVTTRGSSQAGRAMTTYLSSNGILADASFIRVKSLIFSYQWPAEALKKMHLQGITMSLQAQNLFTLTPYQDGDPEIQRAITLPPMRSVMANLQVRF
jgi:TonB-linked SusC/RagA family outer membrane protein